MTALKKITQLDLFINEKIELENKFLKEEGESTKRQLRLLHHMAHESTRRLDKQEELMAQLIDYILSEEKTPVQM